MSYFPLDRDILISSMWAEPPQVLKVWIYLLLSADQDGFVKVTAPALGVICGLSPKMIGAVLAVLEGPDANSRSKRFGGRRIKKVPGGYKILNYVKRRDKDYSTPRWRKWKERQIQQAANAPTPLATKEQGTPNKGSNEGGEKKPAPPPRFPSHCPEHADTEFPPKCGGCKEARERYEAHAVADIAGSGSLSSDLLRKTRASAPTCAECGRKANLDAGGLCPLCHDAHPAPSPQPEGRS